MICRRCGRPIAGTIADPVHWPSRGPFHGACMLADERDRAGDEAAHRAEVRAARSAAMKARHAATLRSPEPHEAAP